MTLAPGVTAVRRSPAATNVARSQYATSAACCLLLLLRSPIRRSTVLLGPSTGGVGRLRQCITRGIWHPHLCAPPDSSLGTTFLTSVSSRRKEKRAVPFLRDCSFRRVVGQGWAGLHFDIWKMHLPPGVNRQEETGWKMTSPTASGDRGLGQA